MKALACALTSAILFFLALGTPNAWPIHMAAGGGWIGFALAFGVIVDAFVVRLTLVPAAMAVLGRHAWWLPRWLDKLLPDMDIEGNSLEKEAELGGHYRPTPRPLPQAQS